ncbi:hypothetical protein DVH05_012874 [Phytophthora capsici]|nr:hypothetical protein DVH05_012874 [Phytophthora capsici]
MLVPTKWSSWIRFIRTFALQYSHLQPNLKMKFFTVILIAAAIATQGVTGQTDTTGAATTAPPTTTGSTTGGTTGGTGNTGGTTGGTGSTGSTGGTTGGTGSNTGGTVATTGSSTGAPTNTPSVTTATPPTGADGTNSTGPTGSAEEDNDTLFSSEDGSESQSADGSGLSGNNVGDDDSGSNTGVSTVQFTLTALAGVATVAIALF